MATVPIHERRLARAWLIVIGSARTAATGQDDPVQQAYMRGRADGSRFTYCAAAGLSEQAVRDRIAVELRGGRR